ncbi:nucleotide exchange factor GrpE [Lentibacillus salinarum]|uniref:Nucleotide exchange factor GrpE n=1 Tax=Lentibacillus salinarum TaxID=446820 RepID=A0ABW3ZVH3_9BACI
MGWFFRKKQEETDPVSQEISQIKQQTTATEEKLRDIEQQLQKLTRLQYKTGKSTEDKLDHLTTMLDTERTNMATDNDSQKRVIESLISQIDDMDIVYNRLADDTQWSGLVRKWLQSLLQTLEDLGITEIIHEGDMFDPTRAEAVESIPLDSNHQLYEITTVHKRGFAFTNGRIIRKAHVTTVKGETQ